MGNTHREVEKGKRERQTENEKRKTVKKMCLFV